MMGLLYFWKLKKVKEQFLTIHVYSMKRCPASVLSAVCMSTLTPFITSISSTFVYDFLHLELWLAAKPLIERFFSVTFSMEANEINAKSNVLSPSEK